jgi:methylenetetrahydrofolate--tRNA-(uracil-5-)-methyltransferase
MDRVTIVGAGLAGSEAAFQLARRGFSATLLEMRPEVLTGAHRTGGAAELVCSNSLKSIRPETASGLLKAELDILGVALLAHARESRVAAGHALAVDRELFSASVTRALEAEPRIELVRRRQTDLELARPTVVATGPLTDPELAAALRESCSAGHLYFYDAIAPSLDGDTVDGSTAFWASRYGKGDADYLNIPLGESDYRALCDRIRSADRADPHPFEEQLFFEACLPIEVMVERGSDTLRFGPLKPKGLVDPRTGEEPYAVIQLRRESRVGNLMGMVGFQTRLKRKQQAELIHSIPALGAAVIERYGAIHRNLFLDIPRLCSPYQQDRRQPGLYYAGQICGVEGYVESIMSGLVAALSVAAGRRGKALPPLPEETITGALMNYIHTANENFQPMNANMGVLPPLSGRRLPRRQRQLALAERACEAMQRYRRSHAWLFE